MLNKHFALSIVGLLVSLSSFAGLMPDTNVRIENLMVEYTRTPLGIDVMKPRFSWQMFAPDGARGYSQNAWQIVVKDAEGEVSWDSKKVNDGSSVGILYSGIPLRASTRYEWTVTVWDQLDVASSASSWFETGLMNPTPGLNAWSGAQWIGGGSDDLVFYSHYLAIFNLKYTVAIEQGSTKASFIYGANDTRLMDKNKNIYQVETGRNGNYIKLELDISPVDGTEKGKALLNVYRVGYTNTDSPSKPLQSWEIFTSVINKENKYKEHTISLSSKFGKINLDIDGNNKFTQIKETPGEFRFPGMGERGVSVNLNPVGSGGDYIPYGMLCDIGFSMEAGQKATFSDVIVYNNRVPNSTLFREDLTNTFYKGIFNQFTAEPHSGITISNGKFTLDGLVKGSLVVSDPSRNSAPILRTTFKCSERKIKSARLYATARGIYEIYLNGKRVVDDYFNPGLTQYNVTHLYQTYDVTNMINSGDNAIGAMLSEGWWSGLLSFGDIWNHFGDRQSLLVKLVISYDDGTSNIVTTNNRDWKYSNNGPVIYASLDMGEVYDATREKSFEGWATASFNDAGWKRAAAVPLEGTAFAGNGTDMGGNVINFNFDKLSVTGQIGNNAGIFKVLTAQSMKEVRKGVYVYDLGQNIVGVPRITLAAGEAGKKMTLRYGEVLYPDMKESGNNAGMLMLENYRAALSQDIYIMKEGDQVYQPRFTSHGFKYIEITGIDNPLPLNAVQGVVISSLKQLTADYETSNSKVNKLWSNLVWSNIDNFLTIPTDCPQRNERMGWSGDISVFSRTATYISNADQFLRRHMIAMRDVQLPSGKFTDVAPVGGGFGGVLWGSAGITVPWEAYLQYNDIELLKEHYDAMKAYADYLQTTLDPKTGLSSDRQLGDWLGPQNDQLGTAYLVTAYHVYDLHIMIETAKLLGKTDDAEKFMKMYEERKAFFNKEFVNQDHKTMGLIDGGFGFGRSAAPELKLADTQTSYAVGLALGVFSDENIPYMVSNLKETIKRENKDDAGKIRPEYSLMTGFIGTAWINKALSDNGNSDLAYKLLQNNKYPSWLYSIDQGATTIWERLNGYTVENGFGGNNSMNSFNHYSFGAVGQWMMAYSLGIQRYEAGFRKFVLQPEPDPTGEMTWAKGYYDSMYGRIKSSWKVENGKLIYEATVPANTTAILYLPSSLKSVTESGKPVNESKGITFMKYEKGKAVYEIKSGTYKFSSEFLK
jgi:alpha-L-rhamnosidase